MSAPLLPSQPENENENENQVSNAHSKPSGSSNVIAPVLPTSNSLDAQWSVRSALYEIPAPHSPSTTNSLLSFFHLLERLKTTKREGWRRLNITSGESISDHMYRMSIITMLAPPPLASRLDIPRCTKMALVHDMAELLVGDITPVDNVPKVEKARREAATMDYLCRDLLGGSGQQEQAADIWKIFQEYEESKTDESLFVHDVDKVELLLQMVEYEKQCGGTKDLGEFSKVATKVHLKEMKEWCREILKERADFWKGIGKPATMLDLSI